MGVLVIIFRFTDVRKMRLAVKLCVILVILASICEVNDAKKRGGSRPSSSSSGSRPSSGSSIKTRITNAFKPKKRPSGSSSGSPPKPKSKLKSRLKKAAPVGVGAYAGYKVAKLAGKFSRPGFGNSYGYKFNDWNDWREADGFLCRSNKDCQWIDDNLNCEDYELDFTPLAGWFGGDVISIRGECNCEQGLFWNDDDLSCDRPHPISGIGAIVGIAIAFSIMLCCCCGVCFLVKKSLFS